MQLNNAITMSVSVMQFDEFQENGFEHVRVDPDDNRRMLMRKLHSEPLVIDHHINIKTAYIAPYRIRRPQSAYVNEPLTRSLNEVVATGDEAFGINAVASMNRIEQLRFAYAMAKSEMLSLSLPNGKRFALRIYSRFAGADLLKYLEFLTEVRHGLATQIVNDFSTRSFSYNSLPSNADVWWDATHDAFFTFDANYATRLPGQIDREIEWRKNRR